MTGYPLFSLLEGIHSNKRTNKSPLLTNSLQHAMPMGNGFAENLVFFPICTYIHIALIHKFSSFFVGHSEVTTGAISDNALEPTDVAISISGSPVKGSISQNNQVANQLLQVKIAEAKSQTNVMLI